MQRARAKQRGATPVLSLVGDVHVSSTSGTTPPAKSPSRPPAHDVHPYGAMEKSIRDDLASVDPPPAFFNTLRSAAIALAREIDDIDSKASKAPLVKQLVDIIREIKGKDSDDGESLESFLFGDIQQPTVVAAPKNRNR
jgi:hypothetical protein